MKAHMIRFTKFLDLLFSHKKKRTIRKISVSDKHNPEVGDKLHIWALIKVGEANCLQVEPIILKYLTDKDARLDGFKDAPEGIIMLSEMHKCDINERFQIIDFEPLWKPKKLFDIEKKGVVTMAENNQSIPQEIKRVKQDPTITYEVEKVTSSRSPKTTVRVKIGGDFKIIKDKKFKPTLKRLRVTILEEIDAVEKWNQDKETKED